MDDVRITIYTSKKQDTSANYSIFIKAKGDQIASYLCQANFHDNAGLSTDQNIRLKKIKYFATYFQ